MLTSEIDVGVEDLGVEYLEVVGAVGFLESDDEEVFEDAGAGEHLVFGQVDAFLFEGGVAVGASVHFGDGGVFHHFVVAEFGAFVVVGLV